MIVPELMDDSYSYPLHASGSASTLPAKEDDDKIKKLHEIIEEVTGKKVEEPVKPRMGFLP